MALSLASRSDFLRELTGVEDLLFETGEDDLLTEAVTLEPISAERDLEDFLSLTGVGESFFPLFFSFNGEIVCFKSLGTDDVSTMVLCFLILLPCPSLFDLSEVSATSLPKSFKPRRPDFSSAALGDNLSFLNSVLGADFKFGFCAVFASLSWRPESESSFLYFSDCSIVSLISASTSARGREKFSRECLIMASKLSEGGCGSERVVAENAGTFSPLIIILMIK